MRGLRTDRTAQVIIAVHGFMQNLRRGHYELAKRHTCRSDGERSSMDSSVNTPSPQRPNPVYERYTPSG